jgi:drug/metabolite transporter (DMT)-like permease
MQSIHPSPIGLGFATAASVVNVLASVFSKKALAGNNLFAATFWIRLFAAAVFTIAFLWHVHTAGPLHFVNDTELPLGPYVSRLPAFATFLIYLFLDTALVAVSALLYFRCLQISDLSLSIPFLSFTPAMLVLTGALFLHERPAPEKLIGISLVVLGSLLMNRSAFRFGLLGPVKALLRERTSRYMLIVAVILSITNPLDKKLVMMSDAFTQAFAYGLMLWFLLAVVAFWQRPIWTEPLRNTAMWLVLAGVLDASDLLLQFASHNYIDVVITITLKRAGVILAVLAGWLIFREKQIRDRLVASGVMLAGVIIIYLPLNMRTSMSIAAITCTLLVILFPRSPKTASAKLSEANL